MGGGFFSCHVWYSPIVYIVLFLSIFLVSMKAVITTCLMYVRVCACVHSCVWTKCATAACLLANNTVCLFGSHTPVRTGFIKLSHTHTHACTDAQTNLSSPISFPSVVWSIDEFRHSRGGYVPLSCYRGDGGPRLRSGCHWLPPCCFPGQRLYD